MFKCECCKKILKDDDLIDENCPLCGLKPAAMCPVDRECTCLEEISEGLVNCPECGKFMCPCGSHDVVVISRITGYLSDVSGWGAGKLAELKDRTRYNDVESLI